jgi:zinc protease
VLLGYKSPALGDVDHAPLDLLNEVLFGGRASRVHRALVEEQALATYVSGGVGIFRDPYLYMMGCTARGEHTATAMVAALDVLIDGVRREPVTAEELDRAKARLERQAVEALEDSEGRAFQVGFFEIVGRDPGMFWQRLDRVRAATVGDLLRVARRYLVTTARSVVEVQPGEEPGAGTGMAQPDTAGATDNSAGGAS